MVFQWIANDGDEAVARAQDWSQYCYPRDQEMSLVSQEENSTSRTDPVPTARMAGWVRGVRVSLDALPGIQPGQHPVVASWFVGEQKSEASWFA